jgi:hypothetical protein
MAESSVVETKELIAQDFRVNFQAVFTGVIVALSLQILFNALGNALGISLMSPSAPNGVRATTSGPIVWTLLIPIATFFIGGYTAAITAHADRSGRGLVHGLLVWGLSLLFGVSLFALVQSHLAPGGAAAHFTTGTYWLLFFSACTSLLGALSGGYMGSMPIHRSVYGRRAYFQERHVTP